MSSCNLLERSASTFRSSSIFARTAGSVISNEATPRTLFSSMIFDHSATMRWFLMLVLMRR